MQLFDATQESINDPARVSALECASLSGPTRRIEIESAMPPVSPAKLAAGTQHESAQQDQVRVYIANTAVYHMQEAFVTTASNRP